MRDPESARRLEEVVGELEVTVDQVIRSARRPVRHSVVPLVDVLAVAKSRTAFWAPLADDQGRHWSLDGAADGPIIVAVEMDDLEAALDALIDNVFAHTAEAAADTSPVLSFGTGPIGPIPKDRTPFRGGDPR